MVGKPNNNEETCCKFSAKRKFDNRPISHLDNYEGWNFNSGNYLFTTDTK